MTPFPSRRGFLRLAAAGGAAGVALAAGHDPGRAQDAPGGDAGAEFITPDTQAAIDRGMAFLARSQNDDGSFLPASGGSAVGVAGLCGLALMAGGHQPGRGRYARVVSKAVDFVLGAAAQTANNPDTAGLLSLPDLGSWRNTNQQSAYSHGFAALFLSEVCGMLPDPARQKAVRATLEQAVGYTVSAQNKDGGWRYTPRSDADVSVTVAQMMALRAARNAGLFVRKAVVDRGVAYVRGCQTSDGGFSYMKGQGFPAFARSAAALVGLYSAGVYSGKEVDRGLRYLQQYLPVRQFSYREVPPHHYYYGQYYAALAMWTAGGEYWTQWFPAVRDDLLTRNRQAGGNWTDDTNGSPYATAMSLIVLQLPNNYLPILQK